MDKIRVALTPYLLGDLITLVWEYIRFHHIQVKEIRSPHPYIADSPFRVTHLAISPYNNLISVQTNTMINEHKSHITSTFNFRRIILGIIPMCNKCIIVTGTGIYIGYEKVIEVRASACVKISETHIAVGLVRGGVEVINIVTLERTHLLVDLHYVVTTLATSDTHLFVAAADRKIHLINLSTLMKERHFLTYAPITVMTVHNNELVTAEWCRKIYRWDLSTYTAVLITQIPYEITQLVFLHDQMAVVTTHGTRIYKQDQFDPIPFGTSAVISPDNELVVGYLDGSIRWFV